MDVESHGDCGERAVSSVRARVERGEVDTHHRDDVGVFNRCAVGVGEIGQASTGAAGVVVLSETLETRAVDFTARVRHRGADAVAVE